MGDLRITGKQAREIKNDSISPLASIEQAKLSRSLQFDDTFDPALAETSSLSLEDDLDFIRSQIKIILGATDWFQSPADSVFSLDTRVAALETGSSIPAHASSHQDGGLDEIDVTGLSGQLFDPQIPLAHASSHQPLGTDPIDVTGIPGLLADPQKIVVRKNSGANIGTRIRLNLIEGTNVGLTVADDGADDEVDVTIAVTGTVAPSAHATWHQNSGPDEISVTGLSGLLADQQTPLAHATSHQNTGGDEISVTGLSGLLADPQYVQILKDAGLVGTQTKFNLTDGAGITITAADDGGNSRVNVDFAVDQAFSPVWTGSHIFSPASDLTEFRRTTNPQTASFYSTYASGTDYERLTLKWSSNIATVLTEKGSGGGSARVLRLGTGGVEFLELTTAGSLMPVSDNTTDLGSSSLRYKSLVVIPAGLQVVKTVSDANPVVKVGDALIELGAGGASAVDTTLYRSAANVLATDDDFAVKTAGKGLQIKEGSDAKMGLATLSGGTVVVSTTAVTATSRIFLTAQTTSANAGFIWVSARTASTSFTILSSNGSDDRDVAWFIVEPA